MVQKGIYLVPNSLSLQLDRETRHGRSMEDTASQRSPNAAFEAIEQGKGSHSVRGLGVPHGRSQGIGNGEIEQDTGTDYSSRDVGSIALWDGRSGSARGSGPVR